MVDRYRNYQPRVRSRQHRKSRRGLYLSVLVITAFFGGRAAWQKLQTQDGQAPKTSSIPKPKPTVKAEPISTDTWNELNRKMTALIGQNPTFDISVAVVDINTNTKANYGLQDNFAGASTTKVLTAVLFLREVENGKQSLSAAIDGVDAKTLIRRMINRSDNNAWASLNNRLSYKAIEAYAHGLGMSSYNANGNTITASDMALLLQKLYKGELINETHRQLLFSYMQNTNNEDMVPVVKPADATLYHKYGQLEDRLHDAAILNYKDRPLALVIYTKGGASDGSNYAARIKLVQQLAQTVFDTVYP